jgi:hypothetical protein
MQLDVRARAEEIEKLIGSMDQNNAGLKNDIGDYEEAVLQLEAERNPKTLHIVPGEKIHEKMTQWAQEEVYDNVDLYMYANELWMSLAQFEEQLKSGAKGHEIAF